MIEARLSPTRIPAGPPADLVIRLTNTGQGPCTNVNLGIRLSAGLVRLRGRNKMRWPVISPGESVCETIQVKAREAGEYPVTSFSFSYLDHDGESRCPSPFKTGITVAPAGPRPEVVPPVVEPVTGQLPVREWNDLWVRVSNPGAVDLSEVKVALTGRGIRSYDTDSQQIGNLDASESRKARFSVRASEPGDHVPLRFNITYRGPEGPGEITMTSTVAVRDKRNLRRAKILFLAANPRGTGQLRTDQEIREIMDEIARGAEGKKIAIESRWAVRARDVGRGLLDVQPQFVHFAGHGGGGDESFVAENEAGGPEILRVRGLVRAFKAVGDEIRCVVVNACNTEQLARGLKEALPQAHVIGMRRPVGDQAAIDFSIGFYQAIAAGTSIERSYELGLAMVEMRSGDEEEESDGAPLLL